MSAPHNPIAFPAGSYDKGMALRDWFAGQALNETLRIVIKAGAPVDTKITDRVATLCYQQADAMLAAREQKA